MKCSSAVLMEKKTFRRMTIKEILEEVIDEKNIIGINHNADLLFEILKKKKPHG